MDCDSCLAINYFKLLSELFFATIKRLLDRNWETFPSFDSKIIKKTHNDYHKRHFTVQCPHLNFIVTCEISHLSDFAIKTIFLLMHKSIDFRLYFSYPPRHMHEWKNCNFASSDNSHVHNHHWRRRCRCCLLLRYLLFIFKCELMQENSFLARFVEWKKSSLFFAHRRQFVLAE